MSECYHTWPNMARYLDQKCMRCGIKRSDYEGEKQMKALNEAIAKANEKEKKMSDKNEKMKKWMPPNFANDIKDVEIDENHPDKVEPVPAGSHAEMAAEIADLRKKNKALMDEKFQLELQCADAQEAYVKLQESLTIEGLETAIGADYRCVMGIIADVLDEARENPQRLISFNSPLLGMLMIKYYAYVNDGQMTAQDVTAYQKYKSVLERRREAQANARNLDTVA